MDIFDEIDVEVQKLRTRGSQYRGHPHCLPEHRTMYDRASQKLQILEPMQFLDRFLTPDTVETKPPEYVMQIFRMLDGRRVSERGKEQDMGENEANIVTLKDALQACCPSVPPTSTGAKGEYVPRSPLQCLDVRGSLAEKDDTIEFEPVFLLTFDASTVSSNPRPSKNIHTCHSIPIFVYQHTNYDITSTSTCSREKIKEDMLHPATRTRVMLDYMFAYPWRMHPHQFSWCISIAHRSLRIWRWSTHGCHVTDTIKFHKDCTALWMFLQTIGRSAYSALGVDIGLAKPFRPLTMSGKLQKKMEKIIDTYVSKRTPGRKVDAWMANALQGRFLTFTGWNIYGKEKNRVREDYELVVLSHPIYENGSVFTRSTRCYLALELNDLLALDKFDINDIHVLKTSWRTMFLGSEVRMFRLAEERVGEIPGLVTILASGAMSLSSAKQKEETIFVPELHWVYMDEVGESVASIEHMQNVPVSLAPHEGLHKGGILHRNISDENILFDLATRRGILIDLGNAIDMQDPPVRSEDVEVENLLRLQLMMQDMNFRAE